MIVYYDDDDDNYDNDDDDYDEDDDDARALARIGFKLSWNALKWRNLPSTSFETESFRTV